MGHFEVRSTLVDDDVREHPLSTCPQWPFCLYLFMDSFFFANGEVREGLQGFNGKMCRLFVLS